MTIIRSIPCVLACLIFAAGAVAESPYPAGTVPATQPTSQPSLKTVTDKTSVTNHEVKIGDALVQYRATAGYMPVKDEAGKEKANFFFVAYERIREGGYDPAERPITYVFNGGPGAAAVWLHLGTAGPRRIAMADDVGNAPAPPYRVVENAHSWLDVTDLVFIDPVGTGYSRAAPGQKAEQFYGVQEDVQWVGEFIRLYTTRFERWLSPKFLAGESYGTTRAAALSSYLSDRVGINVNGIVLISVVLDFGTIRSDGSNDLPYVLFLPSYTAAAIYHGKLSPPMTEDRNKTLREAEQFAVEQYLPALMKGSALPAERREKIVRRMSELTGLDPAFIEKSNLRVEAGEFRKMLFDDDRKVAGRFDSRITGYDPNPAEIRAGFDPSLSGYYSAYSAAINDYVRRTLKYENDLPYEVLSPNVGPWNFGPGGRGYLNVADELRSAMIRNHTMKVLFASGYYDLATPYFATDYTVNRMDLGKDLRENIVQTYYTAGHMMYHELASLKKLKKDVAGFMLKTVGNGERVAGE